MISDFNEEVDGFLTFEVHSARVSLEIQKDGYFDNDKLMKQVDGTVDILKANIILHMHCFYLTMRHLTGQTT